jgi:hypothetical protein
MLPAMLLLMLPGASVVPGKGETPGQLALFKSLSYSTGIACQPYLHQDEALSSYLLESGPVSPLCCRSTVCEVSATWGAVRAQLMASSSVSEVSSINSAQGPAVLEAGIAATCLLLFLLAVIVGLLMASTR